MRFGSISQRSQSRRTRPASSATNRASPAPTRRAERRQAVGRACLEALEDRRLLSFSPAVTYPAGESPQGIGSVDFNNDGNFDLITGNADNTVNAFLSNAVGAFPRPQASAADAYGASTPGDVNGDGMTDLVWTAEGYHGEVWGAEIVTQINNGDGTFAPAVGHVISGYRSYAAFTTFGDLNADRKMDAVVILYDDTDGGLSQPVHVSVRVLLGRGDGTFALGTVYQVGFYWDELIFHSPSLADFNRDGNIDLAVGETTYDYTSGTMIEQVKVFLGGGNGSLQLPRDYDLDGDVHYLGAGDVTGDGIPDLVTSAIGALSVLPGRGDGTFAAPIVHRAPAPSWRADADFNGDGLLDRVVLEATTDSGGVASLLLGRADGTFQADGAFDVGLNPTAITAGDFNGDGRPDIAVSGMNYAMDWGAVSVLLNTGTWTPPPPSLSVNDATVNEGNTGSVNATFTLKLSRATNVDVTVHVATANITTAAGDYTAVAGTMTIPAGQTRRTFTVAVAGDRLAEPGETFAVNLTAATNATIGDGQGIGAIVDDEPYISINDVTRLEGKNGRTTYFTFTATLSAAYDEPVTTSFRTADGTARTGDRDYFARAGTITFNPGETSKIIIVEVKGDTRREASETFYLDLFGNSSNSLFARSRGIGTILNDD